MSESLRLQVQRLRRVVPAFSPAFALKDLDVRELRGLEALLSDAPADLAEPQQARIAAAIDGFLMGQGAPA